MNASRSSAQRLRCDGRPVAPLVVARSRAARRRGLLGSDGIDGAMWFPRTSWIHTVGMRFAIDVAWCRADGTVVRTLTVAPNRLCRPVLRARVVVEAAAGAFACWGVGPGSRLEVSSAGGEDAGRAEDGEAGKAGAMAAKGSAAAGEGSADISAEAEEP